MKNKQLIVSVCRGNIARSPFAEEVIKGELLKRGIDDKFVSISRGIQGTIVDPEPVMFPNITYYIKLYKTTKPILEKFRIDLSTHESIPIDQEIANNAAILLAMDKKTQEALLALFPNQKEKIHMLSELVGKSNEITDPEGVSSIKTQNQIFTEIKEDIVNGFFRLLALINN